MEKRHRVGRRKSLKSVDELTSAAAAGDIEQVKYILATGINVNARNTYGRTAIQVMIHNLPELALVLLHAGADPNVQDISTLRTICHDVASSGYKDTLRILLKYGTDINIQDKWGNTPAHNAAKAEHFHVVQYLSCGVDLKILNYFGFTTVNYVEENGGATSLQWLDKVKYSPRSLCSLSVINVRHYLGVNGLRKLRHTNIRRVLKNLILLQDEENIRR